MIYTDDNINKIPEKELITVLTVQTSKKHAQMRIDWQAHCHKRWIIE